MPDLPLVLFLMLWAFSFFFLLLSVRINLNSYINPIFYGLCFFYVLLLIAVLGVQQFDKPDYYTSVIYIISLTSISFGLFLSKIRVKDHTFSHNLNIIESRIYLLLLICFLFMIIPYFNMIKHISANGYISFLKETRWQGSDPTAMFGSSFLYSISNVFIKAMTYVCYFASVSLLLVKRVKTPFILSLLNIVLLSVLFSSRIEIMVVFLVIIAGISLLNKNSNVIKINKLYIIIFIILGFASTLYFSYMRFGSVDDLYSLLTRYLVDYHTLGFTMFSKEFADPYSLLNTSHTFGLASFPILDYFPEQFSRFLPYDYSSVARDVREHMSKPIMVSSYIQANAFYTSIYLFYLDFGMLGVLVIPLMFGCLIGRAYNSWRSNSSMRNFSLVLFWIYSLYTALFFPPQVTEFYWFVLIGLYMIYSKRYFRFESVTNN